VKPKRIVALYSGSDWCDASVDHLVIPEDLNLDEAYKRYKEWYSTVYKPNLDSRRYKPWYLALGKEIKGEVKFRTFRAWLVDEEGARRTEDDEVEEWWEG